ncbi:transmembrane protein, putative [Medicago truncatula]|uniref:Transmembrane protein, putative n=1 Tax=Medicago truncatula TaxID=3880 RepID=A0A072UDI8_MEDTR|nr:transmembrane protein, putative [Medicago truncatula]
MYSLSTLSSLYPRLKKRMMKKLPLIFLAYWGILAVEAANIKRDCPEDDFHVQRPARDATIFLARILYFKLKPARAIYAKVKDHDKVTASGRT